MAHKLRRQRASLPGRQSLRQQPLELLHVIGQHRPVEILVSRLVERGHQHGGSDRFPGVELQILQQGIGPSERMRDHEIGPGRE